MRQRVGFARALVVEPAALLMDEPFSALDVLTSENLRGELLELWEGQRFPTKTIIMVTHNIEEAVLLADRLLVLGTNPGRIRADMRNPLPRPRRRRTPDFEELVDQIYRMMTQRDRCRRRRAGSRTGGRGPRHARRFPAAAGHGGRAVRPRRDPAGPPRGRGRPGRLADNLGLEVDDLLPLVDALVLLGFAGLDGDRLELTGQRPGLRGRQHPGQQGDLRPGLAGARAAGPHHLPGAARQPRRQPAGRLLHRPAAHQRRRGRGGPAAGRRGELGPLRRAVRLRRHQRQIIREDQGIGATLSRPARTGPARRAAPVPRRGAGQGKTFTMLREGRALRDRGEDVVIGPCRRTAVRRTAEAIGRPGDHSPAPGEAA